MRFELEFSMDGAAFHNAPIQHEVSRVLERVGMRFGHTVRDFAPGAVGAAGTVLDSNGNRIGEWRVVNG